MTDEVYGIENVEALGAMMNTLAKPDKIVTYDLLARGHEPSDIEDHVDTSHSTVYNYRNEFIDMGWMDTDGNLTQEGEFVYQKLQQLDEEYGAFLYEQARDEFIEIAGLDPEDGEEIDEMLQDLDE